MKLPVRQLLWLAFPSVLLLMGAGCSGINMSHSVSPATFFMPGVMRADPPPNPPEQAAPPSALGKQVALAR